MIESKEITNPFPGLRPFETDEYRLFFGREGQSDALIARLQRSHFLAVVGTSGSGKSSLVRAGLLPALRGGMMAGAGSGWRIAIMRPGSDPIGNLAGTLTDQDVLLEAGGGLPAAEAEAVIEATLRRGALGLIDAARQARLSEPEKLLVVVDQFEELFRFRGARAPSSTGDDASAFVKLLLEASQQTELSIYVVPTMRSDFLGDCAQFQGLPEAINDGQYLIPRMTRDERRFAITGPVGVKRRKITESLVNRLMNDVGDNPDQLPILQHALMRTWDHWAAHRRNGEPIGLEHYEAIGAMSDALSLHADEAFNELPDERSRIIAERLFKALTERGADNREIRRPTSLSTICEIAGASLPEIAAVIEVFRGGGRSFLMPPAEVALRPETVIDISHESLIRNWRRLQVWVNEEAQSARIYRRLGEAAVLHREGSEGLLQDPGLQIALDWREKSKPTAAWAERYHPAFAEAVGYLEASRDARDAALAESERRRNEELERERRELETTRAFAEKQARSAQRLRRFAFALVLISLLALGSAVGAVYAYTVARSNQKRAEASEKRTLALAGDLEKSQRSVEVGRREVSEGRRRAEALQKTADAKEQQALAEQRKAALAKVDAERATKTAKEARKDANRNLLAFSKASEDSRLNREALDAFQRGNMESAEKTFQTLVTTYSTDASKSSLAWAKSHLGETRRQLGKADKGISELEAAQELQEETFHNEPSLSKEDHDKRQADYLDTLNWLAQAYTDKGRYAEAQPLYLKALKIRPTAERTEKLARNYINLGQLVEAVTTYDEALALRRQNPNSPGLVATLKEVAGLSMMYGEPDGAIPLYQEALRNQESLAPDDPNIATTYNELARAYEELHRKKLADRLNAIARQIRVARASQDSDDLEDLARMYLKDGKPNRAAQLIGRSNEISSREYGADSELRASALVDLGLFRFDTAKLLPTMELQAQSYVEAVNYYQKALEIIQQKALLKKEVPALDGLARVYLAQAKFSEAEVLLKRALEIREQKPDLDLSPNEAIIENLHGLAASAVGQGKKAEAEAYLVRALKIFDGLSAFAKAYLKTAGAGLDPELLRHSTSGRLAEVYRSQGRAKEADEQYRPLAGKMKTIPTQFLTIEKTARNYLEIVEAAGRFYTDRGDKATAESFYRLVWPEGIEPTVRVLAVWPEEYERSVMALAPDASVPDMIRILNAYAALLTRSGRQREVDGISHGISRLQARIEEKTPSPSP